MNINSNGLNFTGERHHYSLYQNQHEFVNQDIKGGLSLNVTSLPEQSSIALSSHLYHYPPHYRQVKRRRRLTEEETNVLNNVFENVQKPDSTTRAQLAQKLNMSSRAIQVWFQNRRAKVKRDALESKNAAKNNVSKKLTLVADYCPENMNQHLSLTLTNNSTSPHNSTPKHLVNNCANLSKPSGTTPNLSVALTSNLCTSLEGQKFSNRNPINSYVSQFFHLDKNEYDNNEVMNGLIQCEKSGCNDDYWNTYLKTVEIDDQSVCDLMLNSCLTNGQTIPLQASSCFSDNNLFQIAQDDSFRFNLSEPLGIVTLPPTNSMANLLNMSNILNTGYPINNKQTSTWFLDTQHTQQKATSNIFEPNTQDPKHL
ncbi:homeobox protein hd-10 [Rhizophagus clarus]|nr:homeobox protein hd-10 [Rhizophagus clarus]